MKYFVWRDCLWLLHSQPFMVKVALENLGWSISCNNLSPSGMDLVNGFTFFQMFFRIYSLQPHVFKNLFAKICTQKNVDSYLKILTLCSKWYFRASYLVLNSFLKDKFHCSNLVPVSTKECELEFSLTRTWTLTLKFNPKSWIPL